MVPFLRYLIIKPSNLTHDATDGILSKTYSHLIFNNLSIINHHGLA